mmetsp:Transcript_2236/g.6056  ORF Transcript_2236/g.6056 Transcript_2236/m.6056 type:complete len:88 (-) Transcript_2236:1027-1290(-)
METSEEQAMESVHIAPRFESTGGETRNAVSATGTAVKESAQLAADLVARAEAGRGDASRFVAAAAEARSTRRTLRFALELATLCTLD